MSEQAKASRHRMDDARALFNAVRRRGAMYLAGYAIECLLKIKLMRIDNCLTSSDLDFELRRQNLLTANSTIFTHQLELLIDLTKAKHRLKQIPELWLAFNTVNRWVPAWRYSADLSNRDDAEGFLEAVESLLRWIENNT
ncbi:HEPN domain-containing protein [Singulisphaera rosea]